MAVLSDTWPVLKIEGKQDPSLHLPHTCALEMHLYSIHMIHSHSYVDFNTNIPSLTISPICTCSQPCWQEHRWALTQYSATITRCGHTNHGDLNITSLNTLHFFTPSVDTVPGGQYLFLEQIYCWTNCIWFKLWDDEQPLAHSDSAGGNAKNSWACRFIP